MPGEYTLKGSSLRSRPEEAFARAEDSPGLPRRAAALQERLRGPAAFRLLEDGERCGPRRS